MIRLCVAINTIDAASDDGGLVFEFLRFAFCGVVFVDIAFPKMGVRRLCRLTLTLSLSRFVPRSVATMAWGRTRKLNPPGKPKLTTADGLQIGDLCPLKLGQPAA